jgi:DNA-binding NarL/FixJ family response regulator
VDAQPDAVLTVLERNQDELAEEITALTAETSVILVAHEPQPALIADALRGGVRALLPADSSPAEIVAAITAAAAGFVVLHPEDVSALVSAPVLAERASEGIGQSLTPREVEVLRLMADGEANKGIAWKLGISDHTVKFHVASIMSKLRASSRTEAVTLGIRRGLIPL